MMLNFLLKRKIIVGLFTMIIFLAGYYGISKLDKELLPNISFDQAVIIIETEDLPAEDVEQFITIPVEQVISNVKHVTDYESTSANGESMLIVDIADGKGAEVTRDIENHVNRIKDDLSGIKDVFIAQISTSQHYEFVLDISGESLEQMTTFASDVVKTRLEALPEVNDVLLTGLEEKEIIITLDEDKLTDYEITPEDIMYSMEQTNTNIAIGSLDKEEGKPAIRWNTTLNNITDVREVPVQTNKGTIKLAELAKVTETSNNNKNTAWKNGDPNFIVVQISRSNGYTQIDMAESVRAEIKEIEKEIDNNIKISEVAAQADYVNSSIEGVTDNIIIGGIIAIIVLLLFLRNFRATFIISLSIPTSVLLTILTMTFLDYSFNLISLIGLGLGIGMMVDASIVVLESIFKKKEQGYSNFDSVIIGTKEVFSAVVSSMLTTIVVFIPITIMDDDVGKMMIILTIVVAVTLISSVIIAFTLIPALSENFLKVKSTKKQPRFSMIQGYGNIIEWITKKKRRRISIIGLFFIIFFSSFILLDKIPKTIMPDILDRYAEVMVELEPGVSTDVRDEIAAKMNEELGKIPDVESNIVLDESSILFAVVHMTPEEEKTMEQSEVNEEILHRFRALEEDYPIATVGAAIEGTTSMPIEVKVSGEDLKTLEKISNDVVSKLEKIDNIETVKAQTGEATEEYVLRLKHKEMEQDGLTPPYLYTIISNMFADMYVGEVVENGKTTLVKIQNNLSIEEKQQLLNEKIITTNGEKKLSNYISLEKSSSLAEIDRSNGQRYINIVADYQGEDLGAINLEIQKVINNLNVDQGYFVSLSGDLQEQQEAMQDLLFIFLLSLLLVFVVMAIQFNSLKHPFIILFIIPLTVTGVLIGLFLTQKELNIMSGIGIIMLVGIVLNNGILLIDRVRQLRNQEVPIQQAIVDAGKDRIRPIFMTTLTTVGGMLPLALATGTSSAYQSPLAVVIISGLLFSTLITLILIPAIYLVFEDMTNGFQLILNRKKKKAKGQTTSSKVRPSI